MEDNTPVSTSVTEDVYGYPDTGDSTIIQLPSGGALRVDHSADLGDLLVSLLLLTLLVLQSFKWVVGIVRERRGG